MIWTLIVNFIESTKHKKYANGYINKTLISTHDSITYVNFHFSNRIGHSDLLNEYYLNMRWWRMWDNLFFLKFHQILWNQQPKSSRKFRIYRRRLHNECLRSGLSIWFFSNINFHWWTVLPFPKKQIEIYAASWFCSNNYFHFVDSFTLFRQTNRNLHDAKFRLATHGA